jgi:hypothetical protein
VVLALLCVTLVMQTLSWLHSAGFQLADSVEFMDRASSVVQGHQLDTTHAVRSFGFSTLMMPFFAVSDWLGVGEDRLAVHAVRIFQMLMGIGVVYQTMRLGAQIGGRRVGLVSGFLVATNPIFLQYSVDPVSGIAATFFISSSLNLLIARRPFLASVGGGLLMGLAFMMAYQSLLLALPVLGLMALRDRTKVRSWGGAWLGFGVTVAAQIVLDKITYDAWGLSLTTYLAQNGGGVFFSVLFSLGLEDMEWVRSAYDSFVTISHEGAVVEHGVKARSLQSRWFYWDNLREFLVMPAQAIALFGLVAILRRMKWMTSILFITLLLGVLVMSFKGAKSFRLWLPLLPLIAPLCALGWSSLTAANSPTRAWWRTGLSTLILGAVLVMSINGMYKRNTAPYGSYWDAMEYVNTEIRKDAALASERGEPVEKQIVAAAYDWAVFRRGNETNGIFKLRWHLDNWINLDETQRRAILEQLPLLDWFIIHGSILKIDPVLNEAINAQFEVANSFWEPRTTHEIADIRVFRKLRPKPSGTTLRPKRLWTMTRGVEPEEYRKQLNLDAEMPSPALWIGEGAEGEEERLMLLGYEMVPIGNAGFSWLTCHWYTPTGFTKPYHITMRISTLMCPWSWNSNEVPAHGSMPTTEWEAGSILSEGRLVVPGDRPFLPDEFKPIGGSYRRGSRLPALFWARIASPPPGEMDYMLTPSDWQTGQILRPDLGVVAKEEAGIRTPLGYIVSGDGMFRVGRLLLPVHERMRWPDDGSPGPDDDIILAAQAWEQKKLEELEKAAAKAAAESPLDDTDEE